MIFCRYITNILSVHLLQSMKFSVNTAVLHAPLAYLAYSERGIEDSISKIPLKNVLFFPQHCYISQSDSFHV